MPTAVARTTKQPQETAHDPRPFPGLRRFTLAEYHDMARQGILSEGQPCELIHGLIVEKSVILPAHATAVRQCQKALTRLLGVDAVVRVQSPLTLADSEPEPDLAVTLGTDDDYISRHPKGKECLLVIEVADSSLEVDRTVKCELYAAAKIPAYWLINLRNRLVEVYTLPKGGKQPGYRQKTEYQPDESIDLPIGDISTKIRVTELLPKKA